MPNLKGEKYFYLHNLLTSNTREKDGSRTGRNFDLIEPKLKRSIPTLNQPPPVVQQLPVPGTLS